MSHGYTALTVRRDRGVAFVSFDHPPVNLVDAQLITDLDRFHDEIHDDAAIRVIVFQSALPDFFLAHGDMRLVSEPETLAAYAAGPGPGLYRRFAGLPQVTIAKVAGRVRGGGAEFLLYLDLRYAALGSSWFGQPEVSLGIIPGGGGTQLLPRLIGRSRALEVVLGGGRYDAATAERYGWIDRALPAAELDAFVDDLAFRIAAQPPAAVAAAKEAIAHATDARDADTDRETALLMPLFTGPEARQRFSDALAAGAQTHPGELDLEGLLGRLGAVAVE
ncbi:enoyl-CoA hydratase/isomerase family protein [Nocardia sp. NBC_00416]|uniref:enoyl-CoA hydratase/isomerase family protein n=1 Tax=Nocardia sp. NBC_00416 TaxID=2975991 RepID=UPI002E21C71B